MAEPKSRTSASAEAARLVWRRLIVTRGERRHEYTAAQRVKILVGRMLPPMLIVA